MHVYPCDFQDGSVNLMKEVGQGDSIHSLLSILDVLTVSHLIQAHL